MSNKKDIEQVVKAAKRQGFDAERTTKGHWTIYKDGQRVATVGGTPSDYKARDNFIARLRSAGFRWPPTR